MILIILKQNLFPDPPGNNMVIPADAFYSCCSGHDSHPLLFSICGYTSELKAKKHERELLSDSFENIARSVTGRKIHTFLSEEEDVNDAVSGLLKHMGVKEREVPATVRGLRDRLDFLLSSTGILLLVFRFF